MVDREFIGSLQRALKSRGLYRGTLTGVMDAKTKKSVRWFQKRHGLNSNILSLEAARQLGLVSYLHSLKK
jgi:peptidoglycan hydrolase-like protein with peptidoglycan-binding domain